LRYVSQTLNSGLPGGITEADFLNRSKISYKPSDHGKTQAQSWLASLGGDINGWRWVTDWTHRLKTVESNSVSDGNTKNVTPSDRWGLRTWQQGQLGALSTQVVLGLDAESWKQTRIDDSRVEQNMQAAYGKFEVTHPGHGLSGFVGGRRTLANRKASAGLDGGITDRNTSADGGLSWALNETSQAYLYRGNSFRLANADEYVCYPTWGTCPTNPINALSPQRSQDTEVGYKFTTEQMQQTLRVYRHRLTNEIGLDETFFNNINYDPTLHKGIEWDQKLRLNTNWSLKTQLASRDNRFVAGTYAGQKMPAPEQSVQAQLTYAWNKNERLTWATTWFSSQKIAGDFAGTCADKTPAFVTQDLFYFRQIDQWQWTVGVKNLTDKNYYTVRTRCNPTLRSIYPEAGRGFFVGAKHLF
jgi:iron complex outermembrane receptor protein